MDVVFTTVILERIYTYPKEIIVDIFYNAFCMKRWTSNNKWLFKL